MRTSRSNGTGTMARGRGLFHSVPGLFVLFVLIVYPLCTLLLQIGFPHLFNQHMSWAFSLGDFRRVLQNPLNLEAIGNSFWIGCVAALISVCVGTLTAFGTMMASGRTRQLIHACVWIIFFAPSFVVASGWVILLQGGGVLQQLLHVPPSTFNWFFTPLGLFLVMGLRYFPFAHFAMTQAIQNIGPEYLRAARLFGASPFRRVKSVWIPLLAPALFAGATIAFAEGFGDFGLASVITPEMQIPLVSYQIYAALYELPVDFSSAATLSFLVIIVTASALMLQFWWLNRRAYGTISSANDLDKATSPRTRRIVISITLLIVLFGLILPFGATLVESFWKNTYVGFKAANWTFKNYASAFSVGSAGLTALLRTAEYAVIAAAIIMVLGLVIGQQMTFQRNRISRILNTVTMATIAIPGVVLGVGYVFAWNAKWLTPLHLVIYGTPLCLAFAYIAIHLPYAVRLQLSSMKQISPNLLTAARVLGARKSVVMRKVVMPLVLETTISTALITFTGVMFELPAASLLYPAGQPPYAVLVDHLFADFQWAAGSCLTIVGMLVVLGSYVLGNIILRRLFGKDSLVGAWGSAQSEGSADPSSTQGRTVSVIQ